MRRRHRKLLLITLILIQLTSVILVLGRHNKSCDISFKLVKYQDYDREIETTGSILGNEEFKIFAQSEGLTGNGTLVSPYIIERYNFTVLPNKSFIPISLNNMDLFIEIKDCLISGGSVTGIKLNNVSNVKVFNNKVLDLRSGDSILVRKSKHVLISNNYVMGASDIGIHIYKSEGIFAEENIILNCRDGIKDMESNHSVIQGNDVSNCSYSGIHTIFAINSTVRNNTITTNPLNGLMIQETLNGTFMFNNLTYNQRAIDVYKAENNTIVNNSIINNTGRGMVLYNSFNNTVKFNVFLNNSGTSDQLWVESQNETSSIVKRSLKGIKSQGGNNIRYNDFIKDNEESKPQVLFQSSSNENKIEYNCYWHTKYGPIGTDADEDGIIDSTYFFSKNEEATNLSDVGDPYPLARPVNYLKHLLGKPTIINPQNGNIVSDKIELKWIKAIDSLKQKVVYSIYYSNDSGSTWVTLVEDLGTVSYLWNLIQVEEGKNYTVKIIAKSGSLTTLAIMDGTFEIMKNNVTASTDMTSILDSTTSTESSVSTTDKEEEQTSGFVFIFAFVAITTIFIKKRYQK